jgi:hypothetical protein
VNTTPKLPPYRGVVVVDTENFGGHADSAQHVLAEHIPGLVARAFDRAGLREVWQNALFPDNTGDGYGIGFDSAYLPAVVTRFFESLQQVLAEQDELLRRQSRYTPLRMRASVNVGPVHDPNPDGCSAVAGSTLITTHRMLDAQPIRDLLARSDQDQTFLAVALSQRVFDDVVVSGFASLPPSKVVPTRIGVKEFTGTVYLYVPNPSGDLLRTGLAANQESQEQQRTVAANPTPSVVRSSTNTISGGHQRIAIQVGHLHGGLHTNEPDTDQPTSSRG